MAHLGIVHLAKKVNALLGKTGFRIVRVSTLDRLINTESLYNRRVMLSGTRKGAGTNTTGEASLEARVAVLEERSEDQSIMNVIRYAMKSHWRTIELIEKITGSDKPNKCALCGHEPPEGGFKEVESQCIFHGGRLLRHECPNCGVIFGPQKMLLLDEEMLDLEYRNLYRIYTEGNTTEYTIRSFHLLNPRKDGVYLDFGCGGEWTEAITRLRSEGWNIYGFEPSASNSSEYVFSKWEDVEARRFDGIISNNVLEHLFDPAGTTRRLGKLLTKGGRIVHSTSCFDYCIDFTHYHVFFFTGRSPEVLADMSGMRLLNWVRDGEYIACIMQKAD